MPPFSRATALLALLAAAGCGEASVKLGDDTAAGHDSGGDSGVDSADSGDTSDSGDTGSVTSGAISVSPDSVDFGVIFVGASASTTLSLTNVGDGPVKVAVSLTGDFAAEYAVDTTLTMPTPGESAVVGLSTAPTTWGVHGATLVFDDPLSGGHIEVPVTANVQVDGDGDGYGSVKTGGGDCLDDDATVHPDAKDAWYDGVDSDCAGNDDFDQDGDGVPLRNDCDDTDASVHPGADDAWYDGVDSDCAGNDDFDQDGDGVQLAQDCDDTDATVHPGAPDAWYDGVDSDCAGNDDFDQDGDGYRNDVDCNDTDPHVYPGAPETWYDGVDSDCAGDSDYDQDHDGYTVDTDCDDTDPTVTEPTDEVLDWSDNDCDGMVDDLPLDDLAAGVLYGGSDYVGLGDKGQIAMDADVTGDGVVDLVAACDGYYSEGYLWLVDSASFVGAAADIGDVDRAFATGASYYYALNYVATPAGDLGGDGAAELIGIGANGNRYGYAWGWSGATASGTISLDAADFRLTGNSDSDQLMAVGMGDVDGDGVTDVVSGAPLENSETERDNGEVDVYAGGSVTGDLTIDSGTAILGDNGYDYLGYRVVVADLEGDGYADIVASAPGDDDGGDGAGAVYVFPGNASMTWAATADDAATTKLTGPNGYAMGSDPMPVPGDVDGDGALDIGIPSEDRGVAYVILGSSLPLGAVPMDGAGYTFSGVAGDYATAMVMTSDLDGDGADEVALGGDGTDGNGSNSGVVWIYRFSDGWSSAMGSGDASATLLGPASESYAGSGLAGGGDVTGDGLEDLVIGAVQYSGGARSDGAVFLIPGW